MGFDPISFGATVAAAMELFEMGAITQEQTGGVELKFGFCRSTHMVCGPGCDRHRVREGPGPRIETVM